MKYGDIQKLRDAGLITGEQRDKIIAHFNLKEDGSNKFLAIVSIIGAVLITAGIILLISAHWNDIPRGGKIAGGILLMLGAHAGGWWLRERGGDASSPSVGAKPPSREEQTAPIDSPVGAGDGASPPQGKYRKIGEALHLIGSGLFLANIALLGQIYNIVSRPPNAFLVWWIGIAVLPWLLRSKAQHVLLLLAFGIWFGFEVNERGSLIFCGSDYQMLLYSLLGLAYLGSGWVLRRSTFADFAGVTEKFGLFAFLAFFYPLTWKDFFGGWDDPEIQRWIFPTLGLVALLPLAAGIKSLRALTAQWRWTWFGALLGMMFFTATVWFGLWQLGHVSGPRYFYLGESWNYLVGILALFVFCLLQIQVGLQERSPFLVNLGVAFLALDILAAYCDLFGSMTRTGVMFLISGIFLIVFSVYLEKKRRKLMKQIKSPTMTEVP